MTVTDTALQTLIGDTAAALLPAANEWSVRHAAGNEISPGDGAVAIGARAGEHVIVVIAEADMTRRILAGPPPAEHLADGLEPTIASIASIIGAGDPDPLVELDLGQTLAELPPHAIAAKLYDGERHMVSIVVTPPDAQAGNPEQVAEPQPVEATFAAIPTAATTSHTSGLEVLHDVQMGVTAELGRTKMLLREILQLAPGSVIELDRAASSPVDVIVNGTLIARGEVVVIDEEFGIRITEVVGYAAPRADLGGTLS